MTPSLSIFFQNQNISLVFNLSPHDKISKSAIGSSIIFHPNGWIHCAMCRSGNILIDLAYLPLIGGHYSMILDLPS